MTSMPTPPDTLSAPNVQAWEKNYAMWIHLGGLATLIGIPPVVVPLILWLVKRDQSTYVDDHGKEAVNFQISVLIYSLICIPLMFILIGVLLLIAVWIFALVVAIISAMEANKGRYYRYPMCIRFIR